MDPTLKMSLVFIAILTCHLISTSSAIKIKITTSRFNGVLPMSFDVTCSLDPEKSDFYRTKHIFAIKVSRHGERPLAMLQQNAKILYNRLLTANIEAKGHIDQDPGNSNLTVTFNDVMKEDSGVYNCSLLYWDQWGIMQREEASTNYTIENNNAHDVIRYLVGELQSLQNQLAEVDRKTATQVDKVSAQIQEMEKNHSRETQELKDNVSAQIQEMEKNHSRETQELKDNASFTTAFSAGYNRKDKLSEGSTFLFTEPIFDVGNSYNHSTGVFTAPRHGLYVFHLTVMPYPGSANRIEVHLKANDEVVATLYARDQTQLDQSSVSTAVPLEAGDTIKPVVIVYSGKKNFAYGESHYTLFSGYLLKLL